MGIQSKTSSGNRIILFILGGRGGGEGSSDPRKEEGKKQRGTWQEREGVA